MSAEPGKAEAPANATSADALKDLDPRFLKAVKTNVQRMLLSDDLEMPRMSSLASRILDIASDPNVDVDRIVDLVQADAFLAGKILSLINSAYFATRQEITSLRHAIVLLGLKSVGDLIFSVSVKMTVFKCPEYESLMTRVWEHSVGTAVATEVIAQMRGDGNEPGFMAGLMHDIGKPIVLTGIVEAEQQRMGGRHLGQNVAQVLLDRMHAQVGGLLSRKWRFSDEIQGAIKDHHEFDADRSPLSQFVYCGNRLAHHLEFGYKHEVIDFAADPGFASLKLTQGPTVEKIVSTVDEHAKRLIQTF
jgi:HD-like signal output (HDOD) protein